MSCGFISKLNHDRIIHLKPVERLSNEKRTLEPMPNSKVILSDTKDRDVTNFLENESLLIEDQETSNLYETNKASNQAQEPISPSRILLNIHEEAPSSPSHSVDPL